MRQPIEQPSTSAKSTPSKSKEHRYSKSNDQKRVSPDSYEGSSTRCSQSDSGSTRSHTPSKSIDRSDAESISTTISQDSRGSNKENNHLGNSNGNSNNNGTGANHRADSRLSSEMDDEVVLRRKPEYTRDMPRRTKEDIERIQMMNLKKKTRKRTRKFEIDGVVVTTTTSKVSLSLLSNFRTSL